MSLATELGSGLGAASALLQAHLGLGLVFGALGAGVASSDELRRLLANVPWEKAMRAASQEMRVAPLLALFALIKAHAGGPPDIFVSAGVFAGGCATLFAALLALLAPVLGSSVRGRRVAAAVGAFGHTCLALAASPVGDGGVQLACVWLLARAAAAAQVAACVQRALGAGAASEAVADLDLVATGLAPVAGGLALVDAHVWGPGGVTILPIQPAIYCGAMLALVLLARVGLGARMAGGSELDFHFKAASSAGKQLEPVRFATAALVCGSFGLAVARVVAGTFRLELSTGGFAIEWTEPLTAAAAKLSVLIACALVAEVACGGSGAGDEEEEGAASDGDIPINGLDMSDRAKRAKELPTFHYVKALVSPSHAVLLGLVAMRMLSSEGVTPGDDEGFSFRAIIGAPFKLGFAFTSGAVFIQVITFLVYTAAKGGSASATTTDPPFDVTGTLLWRPCDATARKFATVVRSATLMMLLGGLFLGCLGLGPFRFIVGGSVTAAMWYSLAPEEARATASTVITVGSAAMFSSLGDYLEHRRQAQEAAAALRAAAMAKALEAESTSTKQASAGVAARGGAKGTTKMAGTPDKKEGAKKKHK